jgi:DNA-binding transcriptional LysR family regulator
MRIAHSGFLDLDHLRTFLALARLENFSRAGERIGLSQSGVSRRIRLLEESLGLRLFGRIGRRAVLTSAGRTLRARLETLMREAETLPRLLRDLAEGVQGELRLGACITAANALLPPILGLYRQRYPKVDLALQPGGSGDILGSLRRGELDVGFVASDALSADLTSVGEIPDEVVLIGAPDHRLCRPRVKAKDLQACDFIHRESSSDTRRLVTHWFERNGIQVRTLMDVW